MIEAKGSSRTLGGNGSSGTVGGKGSSYWVTNYMKIFLQR